MPPRISSCSSLLSHLEKLLSAGQTQTPIHFLFYFVSVSYIINPLIIQSLAVSLPLFMSSPFMPFMLSVPVPSNSFSPIIPTPFTAVLCLPFFAAPVNPVSFFLPSPCLVISLRPRSEQPRARVRPAFSVRRHPGHQDGPSVPDGHLPRQRKQRSADGQRRPSHAVGAQIPPWQGHHQSEVRFHKHRHKEREKGKKASEVQCSFVTSKLIEMQRFAAVLSWGKLTSCFLILGAKFSLCSD